MFDSKIGQYSEEYKLCCYGENIILDWKQHSKMLEQNTLLDKGGAIALYAGQQFQTCHL